MKITAEVGFFPAGVFNGTRLWSVPGGPNGVFPKQWGFYYSSDQ